MGKNKKTKTYFVFVTIEGTVGLAAGLEKPSNEEVKETDSKELIANGFRRRGCVFTRLGDLGIDQARNMKQEGELRVIGRYHVSRFLQLLPELEGSAASVASNLRDNLERSKRCRAADEARRSALEASRDMMEKKYPGYRKFQDAFFYGGLQEYGFVKHEVWGATAYEKNDVTVEVDGGEVCDVLIGGKSVEEMDSLNIPEARGIDDSLYYRLDKDNFPFWELVLERAGVYKGDTT